MAPVNQHRNSERAHFRLVTGLRHIHPPGRGRPVRADTGVHVHRHFGPGLAGQRDQPVDPRRPAARVALRRLPHADQRVAPTPQRQFLQAPGPRPVTLLDRLENPAAQPPYLLLVMAPVHTLPGVTIECGQALRSVHQGVQHALRCWHRAAFCSKAHLPTSAPVRARAAAARHPGQLYKGHPGEGPRSCGPCFPAAFRLPGIRFLGTPIPPGDSAPLTAGLPHRLRIPAPEIRTLTGFPPSARVRPGPGRAPSLPRGQRCLAGHRRIRGRRLPPSSGRSLSSRHSYPARDAIVTRHRRGFPDSRPYRSFPSPVTVLAGTTAPWAFP
jgi:hypothetical protein